MKKVVICGGGIAGLTAGIYAQQAGFATEIYEKNALPGGECTGWARQGYHIDNCIHWLTGGQEGDSLYPVWQNIGALGPEIDLVKEDYFYGIESGGKTLFFYRDLARTQAEFCAAAPEDTAELNRFFEMVKLAEQMTIPADKPVCDLSPVQLVRLGMQMSGIAKVTKEYGGETVAEFAARFQNPLLRKLMGGYFAHNFLASILVLSYAFYTSGTAQLPVGGSVQMAQRIAARYTALGGTLHTGCPVSRITQANGRATGLVLADGSTVDADAVVCATDLAVTFGTLLPEALRPRALQRILCAPQSYKTNSAFQAMFGIQGTAPTGLHSGSVLFDCAPLAVGGKTETLMAGRLYDYDDTLYPAGHYVLQVNLIQGDEDFAHWQTLAADKTAYQAEKQRLAKEICTRITAHYPQLQGRLLLLDIVTPASYARWCGAYHGSYMSFYAQKGAKAIYLKNTVPGLGGLVLAGQWLQTNGGLPAAVTSGKFAAGRLQQLLR